MASRGGPKATPTALLQLTGGKRKKEIRNATPPEFRDLLLSIAATARRCDLAETAS